MDPVQAFLQSNSLSIAAFSATSRYYGLEVVEYQRADGTTVAYIRRRFVPRPERFSVLTEHVVAAGDRIDNLAARYLGDAEQYWRICDANRAMRPDDLTATAGQRLLITLPEGIPGVSDAG